jgi:hypothetical protein
VAESKQTQPEKDLVGRLSVAGEEAMHRLATMPGGKALVDTAQSFRTRLDELAVKVRALDPLEKRVAALEKRVDGLEHKPARKSAAAKPKDTTTP